MKDLLVYLAHPSLESLNAATANSIADGLRSDGHQVEFRDLYRLGFDPRLTEEDLTLRAEGKVSPDVEAEQKAITRANGIVFVYPTWWWERPAMMKGFFDRVFTFGFAYAYGEEGVVGLLGEKRVFIAVTHGAPTELYDKLGADLKKIHNSTKVGTLGFCGVNDVEVFTTFGVPMITSNDILPHVQEATLAARNYFNSQS